MGSHRIILEYSRVYYIYILYYHIPCIQICMDVCASLRVKMCVCVSVRASVSVCVCER